MKVWTLFAISALAPCIVYTFVLINTRYVCSAVGLLVISLVVSKQTFGPRWQYRAHLARWGQQPAGTCDYRFYRGSFLAAAWFSTHFGASPTLGWETNSSAVHSIKIIEVPCILEEMSTQWSEEGYYWEAWGNTWLLSYSLSLGCCASELHELRGNHRWLLIPGFLQQSTDR